MFSKIVQGIKPMLKIVCKDKKKKGLGEYFWKLY